MSLVVTISATYGAGGAIVGPQLAQRLGVEFYDRAVPAAVARRLAVEDEIALANDERPPSRIDRIVNAFATLAAPIGPDVATEFIDPRSSYIRTTEVVLQGVADGPGGVILGRAGMVVLAARPGVLRARLDGPVEARVAQAMRLQGLDEVTACLEQRQADRARTAYVQAFYGCDPADASLYHVVLDSTALALPLCVDLLEHAARGFATPRPAGTVA